MSHVNPDAPAVESSVQAASGTRATSYRWIIIALAFIITLVNYLDRSAMAYAIEPLKLEFGFKDSDIGKIQGAFGIGYMFMTTGGGILVDRYGARSVWSIAAILWSACTAVVGAASNFWVFSSIRIMLGLSEGPHFPALTRVVADWLPSQERARSTAFGLAAVPLSSAIGAILITTLIRLYDWKMMFAILGSAGIVWAVIWIIFFRDYPEHSKFVNDAELSIIREGAPLNRHRKHAEIKAHEISLGKTTWKFILTNPALIANNFGFFSFGYLLFFGVTWLPEYFFRTYHLNLKTGGPYLMIVWLTAAVFLVAAGFISDHIWKLTGSMRAARTHLIWSTQLLSGLCFIPIMFNPNLTVALVMISLGMGFGLMANSCFYAMNCDLAKDKAATSLGLMDSYLALAGILAPVFTGYLTQMTGNFNSAFFLLSFFTLSSVVAILILQKPDNYKHS
ncbi:MAG: MFS transporter [Cyanobacteria bacterium SZAS LIN-2]|nr:MFS transporter [Cyanobacteria bacterium SZAS LIN-2]